MVEGFCGTRPSMNLRALHQSTRPRESAVRGPASSPLFLGEFRKFSNSFVVQRHTSFSLVRLQISSDSFRSFVSNFSLKNPDLAHTTYIRLPCWPPLLGLSAHTHRAFRDGLCHSECPVLPQNLLNHIIFAQGKSRSQ